MAKVAFVPYSVTMDAIFSALHVSISTQEFGDRTGWAEADYVQALAAAWNALFLLDDFEYDGQPGDDWDAAEALIHGPYEVIYWSSDQGTPPW